MAQLSPGVVVKETDITTIVPSVASSIGGFVGNFQWGPVLEVSQVNSEDDLVAKFGKPNDNVATSFFTAANFLAYSTDLKLVRVVGSAGKNAVANANATGLLIKNNDHYITNYSSGGGAGYGEFVAKYPGVRGNSVKVAMADANTYASWTYASEFGVAPGTSDAAARTAGTHDEIHVVVVDADGKITGTAGTVLERFPFVSKAGGIKKPDGTSNYYKDVLNQTSKYVWWTKHPVSGNWGNAAANISFTNLASAYSMTLQGGVDSDPTPADIITGYNLFVNAESVPVNLVMTGDGNLTVATSVISLVESRKDAVVFASPPMAAVVNNSGSEANSIVAYRNTLTSSSFAVLDSGYKYQYDRYNDTYRWIPLNGDIAGLCARTDYTNDPWWSPGGLNRGVIKNVIKLAYSPPAAERDTLYAVGVNPVVSFPGQGTVLYGDKTLLSKPSAFDRINVRRLFIVLEQAISKAARYALFEFNDSFTRSQFVNMVEPYLRGVQGRRGITAFKVVCDETNNTPDIIDRNEFVASIFIKPARSINFITLNFVATRTGVDFQTVQNVV